MASLFADTSGDVRALDPGAGVGSLTAALVERYASGATKPRSISLTCYEIEPLLIDYLRTTLEEAERRSNASRIAAAGQIQPDDFILSHAVGAQANLFAEERRTPRRFTHAIMNPPYKKIHSDSGHRSALRRAGIETSNLYTGFMFLAAAQICEGGEMVAIVPRSFCNGPYFKPFRDRFFSMMTLRQIHAFEKRNAAFQSDAVLQENIIIHAVKGAKPSIVKITTSSGGNFEFDPVSRECATADMTQRFVDYAAVIGRNGRDRFVHIAAGDHEQRIVDRMSYFTATLADLGLEVSTGPVVDFRLQKDLRSQPDKYTAPLLYAAHFRGGSLEWPKDMKKPNAIEVTERSRKMAVEKPGPICRHSALYIEGRAPPYRSVRLRGRIARRMGRLRKSFERLPRRTDRFLPLAGDRVERVLEQQPCRSLFPAVQRPHASERSGFAIPSLSASRGAGTHGKTGARRKTFAAGDRQTYRERARTHDRR